MRPEIEYQMFVKQPVEASLASLVETAEGFNVTTEELNRAIFSWLMIRFRGYAGNPPAWLLDELANLEQTE